MSRRSSPSLAVGGVRTLREQIASDVALVASLPVRTRRILEAELRTPPRNPDGEREIDFPSTSQVLPPDLIRLVIAARIVSLENQSPETLRELDQAAEAFASRVPWEDGPNDVCKHDFQGWCEFENGLGGERVCTKCGMGAMAYTLSLGG